MRDARGFKQLRSVLENRSDNAGSSAVELDERMQKIEDSVAVEKITSDDQTKTTDDTSDTRPDNKRAADEENDVEMISAEVSENGKSESCAKVVADGNESKAENEAVKVSGKSLSEDGTTEKVTVNGIDGDIRAETENAKSPDGSDTKSQNGEFVENPSNANKKRRRSVSSEDELPRSSKR